MAFQEIRKKLPFQLAFKTGGATARYNDQYNRYDVAIGGVPFLLKIDAQNPFVRASAKFRKDQVDMGNEPGEQTITGWWLRSQSSFHLGAGLKYGDTVTGDESIRYRFDTCEGVDIWTPGQVTLNKRMQLVKQAGGVIRILGGRYQGNNVYFRAQGNLVFRGTEAGVETEVLNAGAPIIDMTTDGNTIYAATLAAIWQIPDGGSTAATQRWTYSAARKVTIGWTKQRMIAGIDNRLYVMSFTSSSLPEPIYTHANPLWDWADIDEGPQAIYAAGYAGVESVIFRITLDETQAAPRLSSITVVADFPTGELVQVMHAYLGTFLGIGTTKGLRVAIFGTTGTLEYGPLTPTPAPVRGLRARESHIIAGFGNGFSDGTSGVLRMELSNPLPNGRYPSAPYLWCHQAGEVDSVAIFGESNRVLIGLRDQGVYLEHATELEPTGWLRTARQRYGTVWPKLFKRMNVRGEFFGPVVISTIDDKGTETSIATMTSGSDQTQDLSINYPDTPQEFLALKFTLQRDPQNATIGPVWRSYQLKALPGGPRPRQYTMSLLCYDYERDRNEMEQGYPGWGLQRLQLMEELDSSGEVILFEDLQADLSVLVTIEAIEFQQFAPPGPNANDWGGVLTCVLRTLSA